MKRIINFIILICLVTVLTSNVESEHITYEKIQYTNRSNIDEPINPK